jgi:hypothetical protein
MDARGVARPVGSSIDIGAYESGVYLGPPRITVHPVSRTVREDGTVTFSVGAQGDAPLLYQWRLGDGDDIDGATESSYTIDFVTDADEGSYEVVVSNNSGSVTSEAATLTVVHPPTILEDPEDHVVDIGANFFLSVDAEGDEPLRFQWYTNDVRVLGATLSTFTVVDAQAKDAVTYHVQVCNPYGCEDSAPAQVSLTNSAPSIVIQPVDRVVAISNNTSFAVVANGARPLSYQWLLNGTNLANGTNATFNIVNAQSTNAGTYRVRVQNDFGLAFSSNVTLTVQTETPTIVTEPASVGTIAGQTAAFTVAAGGSAPFTYQWYFNTNTALANATNATLTVTNVQTANEGSYRVIVANTLGTATSAPVTLNIVSSLPIISAEPASTNVFTGDTASLTVIATGSDPLRYQWYFNSSPLLTAVSATLNIVNAQATNAGTYHVVVTNVLGAATSGPVTLSVSDSAPFFTAQPASTNATVDGNATFSVAAMGNKPMFYQWFFNDVPVGALTNVNQSVVHPISGSRVFITNTLAGSSLTIGTNRLADEGEYRVVVTNSLGSDASAPATLFLQTPTAPTIQTHPVSTNVYSGETANLSVAATGSGFLRYQWYLNDAPIVGATAATLIFTNAQSSNAGNYHVVVTNGVGGATSTTAVLNVSDLAPAITSPLTSVDAEINTPVNFSVSVVGSKPLLYQWFFNNSPLFSPTNVTLTVTNPASGSALRITNNAAGSSLFIDAVEAADEGEYRVIMMNSFGTQEDLALIDVLGFGT